jgi:Putative metallopeptidase
MTYLSNPLGFIAAIVGMGLFGAGTASAQRLPPTTIDNNDSIFIDGKNYTVSSGHAKGDVSTLVETLGARDLGPGAIVFRSGERLYIVSAPPPLSSAHNQISDNASATVAKLDQPNQFVIQYIAPNNPDLQEIYSRLRDRHFLERIQTILSPLRLPETLTVKTAECGMMNAWYTRENSRPTVTICYELLKTISQSVPKQTTPDDITSTDAVIGQALWLVLHETGHAVFDIFNVPVFGHSEDAADNFATYVMLQFGQEQAKRLIGGAAWAWRAYIADYRSEPMVKEKLVAFASNHGQPQERFYNLMCLAYGADPSTFTDLTKEGFLPPNRASDCQYEYRTLADAFHQEIGPHIDRELARQVMDTSWLPPPETMPTTQK